MRSFFCNQQRYFVQHRLCHSLQRVVMLLGITGMLLSCNEQITAQTFYAPDHTFIQYTGRVDFSNPKLPRFWAPGVYITFQFKGVDCEVMLNDEELGKKHNYIELVVDDKAERVQTKFKSSTFKLTGEPGKEIHTAIIVKNTETGIGYLELAGIRCKELVKPTPKPERKIECIGNSITSGSASDQSVVTCGKGAWYDQHNAWMSYGAVTARALNAQYHLSSVSGIGLMHSCCNMTITMPTIFGNTNIGSVTSDPIQWNFSVYQPDVVTICLGQNDAKQDSAIFCNNYISFLKDLRGHYPKANFVLITSPMATKATRPFMKGTVESVVKSMQQMGDSKVSYFVFEKQYSSGCGGHPSLEEHNEIAALLTADIKNLMKW